MADRNGVDQKIIANTLRDVARYIRDKNIGPEHAALAESWLNPNAPSVEEVARISSLVLGYETARATGKGRKEYSDFMSEGSRWVPEFGYPNLIEHMDDAAFGYFLEQNLESEEDRDPASDWPGKLVPTLIELKELLAFCAYRERLEGKEPVAQGIIDRIEEFKGFSGPCHCAGTSILHERAEYIAKAERYPSETYNEPTEPRVNVTNSVNYAFIWLNDCWLPSSDAEAVEARLQIGGNGNTRFSKNDELAMYKATIQEGLRRGGIKAELTVELGETYGEDAVVVRMKQAEYAKYVAIKRGFREIDLSPTEELKGWGNIMGPGTSETFYGYEPGKGAFYGPEGVYVATASVNAAQSAHIKDVRRKIAGDIAWIRETGFVDEEEVVLPSGENTYECFTKFASRPVPHNQKTYVVGGRYWNSCALHNEINRRLKQVTESISGISPNVETAPEQSKLVSEWFERAGKIYIPTNAEAFQQAALHFGSVYGVKHSHIRPEKLNKSPEEHWWFALHIDAIPDSDRKRVHKDVVGALNEIKTSIDSGGTGMDVTSVMPKKALEGPQGP